MGNTLASPEPAKKSAKTGNSGKGTESGKESPCPLLRKHVSLALRLFPSFMKRSASGPTWKNKVVHSYVADSGPFAVGVLLLSNRRCLARVVDTVDCGTTLYYHSGGHRNVLLELKARAEVYAGLRGWYIEEFYNHYKLWISRSGIKDSRNILTQVKGKGKVMLCKAAAMMAQFRGAPIQKDTLFRLHAFNVEAMEVHKTIKRMHSIKLETRARIAERYFGQQYLDVDNRVDREPYEIKAYSMHRLVLMYERFGFRPYEYKSNGGFMKATARQLREYCSQS